MDAKDYLAVIRARGKMTQAQVADETGISQPTISKIERGDAFEVKAKTYLSLQSLYKKLTSEKKPRKPRTASV